MHSLSFDEKVYSDKALTIEAPGPFDVPSTTELPKGIYFSNIEYNGTGKNSLGDTLWTVTFTYPDDVAYVVDADLKKELLCEIGTASGAVYD